MFAELNYWRKLDRVELNFIGTTAAIIGGIAAAAGSVAGGAIASKGAKNAANTQSKAATDAATLQAQSNREALDFENKKYEEQKALQAPFIESGKKALGELETFKPFQAPGSEFTQDPGYQFRVAEGMKAIERSAASKGTVANPATQKALLRFNQDTASGEYGNVYARRAAEYQNTYDQLASRAGLGRSSSSDLATSAGRAGDTGATLISAGGRDAATGVLNAGAARASGYVGSANAYSAIPGAIGNNINDWLTYSQLMKMGGGATPPFVAPRTGGIRV